MNLLKEIKAHRNSCRFMAGWAAEETGTLTRHYWEGKAIAYNNVAEMLTELIDEYEEAANETQRP